MESPKPSEPRPITSGCYVNINGKEIYIKPDNKYKNSVYDASTGLLYLKKNKLPTDYVISLLQDNPCKWCSLKVEPCRCEDSACNYRKAINQVVDMLKEKENEGSN